MRIARYAAQELKTDFLKQAPIGEVAPEHFRLNFSQVKCAEGVAGNHCAAEVPIPLPQEAQLMTIPSSARRSALDVIVGPIAPTLSVALVAHAACHSDDVHADRR
jgi:hypothetical protein